MYFLRMIRVKKYSNIKRFTKTRDLAQFFVHRVENIYSICSIPL